MQRTIAAACAALLIGGCAVQAPPNTFVVTPELLQQRQLETRRYDGIQEADLLAASSNVLQDLGFNLENSESRLGVLTASKQRDATKAREGSHLVRVTFQRVVRRTNGSTYAETLKSEELYRDFYERLSKSVFLEAHKI